MLLVVPALALAACGGGSSDDDTITDIIVEGGKDPVTICDHLSDDLVKAFGSVETCKTEAAKEKDTGDVKINSIEIKDDTATAKINDQDGDQTLTFTKVGDDWKLTDSK